MIILKDPELLAPVESSAAAAGPLSSGGSDVETEEQKSGGATKPGPLRLVATRAVKAEMQKRCQ